MAASTGRSPDPPRWRRRGTPVVRPPRRVHVLVRYGVAIAAVVGAVLLYYGLRPVLDVRPFPFLTLGVVLAAWYGGLGPGVVASLLGVGLSDVVYPDAALLTRPGDDLVQVLVLLAVSLFIGSATESLRRSWVAAEIGRAREALLADVSVLLSQASGFRPAFQRLADILVSHLADYAVTYVLEGDTLERVGVAHADPEMIDAVRALLTIDPPRLDAQFGAGAVIRTGEPVFVHEIPESMLEASAQSDAHLEMIRKLRPESSIIVPLTAQGTSIGAIAIATSRGAARPYGREDLVLMEEIGAGAALLLESERRREEAQAARARAELSERRAREVEEAGRVLASSLDLRWTIEQSARLFVRSLGDFGVVDLLEDDTVRRAATAHRDPDKEELAERLARWAPDLTKREGVPQALGTREVAVVNGASAELLDDLARDDEHRALLQELGVGSFLIAPMVVRDEVLGTIAAVSSDPAVRYGDAEILHARKLADRAAMAIDNARLHEQAIEALGLRDQVLGVVSHDLRNLLGTVKMGTQALLELDLPEEEERRLLERQVRIAGEAERLITDLLDVSRAEQGRLELQQETTEATHLIRDALDTFREVARRAEVRLEASTTDGLPRARVDRSRTLRVLYNLLSNAIKHTPTGCSVGLGAECRGDGELVFWVSDAGPGIAPDDHPYLFQPFWRSAGAASDGAGLGLAIAKSLVEAQGGRIWLDRSTDEGSTFCFTVPAADASRAAPGVTSPRLQ